MIRPELNEHFRDLIGQLSSFGAEFLLVGGYAVVAHGYFRVTKDFDVWVRPSRENAERVYRALASFGAPLADVSIDELARERMTFQFGIHPHRIDVITSIAGVTFDDAWAARRELAVLGVRCPVISFAHLIVNKRAVGRPQDLADVDTLERYARWAKGRPRSE